jgi:hypothetical protein
MLLKDKQGNYIFYDTDLYHNEVIEPNPTSTKFMQRKYSFKIANLNLLSVGHFEFNSDDNETKSSTNLPKKLSEDLANRPTLHNRPIGHIVPGILWVLLTILALCCISVSSGSCGFYF